MKYFGILLFDLYSLSPYNCIGEQPVLQPGETYVYSSGTVVQDPIGSMLGTYTFVNSSSEFFDVVIPEFHLVFIDSSAVH